MVDGIGSVLGERYRLTALIGTGASAAVYVADDRMAAGVAAIMVRARLSPGTPLTGEGAEVSAIQRILNGAQTMTVYKPVAPEAGNAARLAVDLG